MCMHCFLKIKNGISLQLSRPNISPVRAKQRAKINLLMELKDVRMITARFLGSGYGTLLLQYWSSSLLSISTHACSNSINDCTRKTRSCESHCSDVHSCEVLHDKWKSKSRAESSHQGA